VTLVASAADGSRFAGWGGACENADGDSCELTLDEDTTVTAAFLALVTVPPPPSTTTTIQPPPPEPPPPTSTPTTPVVPPGPPPTSLQQELDRALRKLPFGRIEFNVPKTLKLGESAVIHLVLSLHETQEELKKRITEVGETQGAQIKVSDEMEAHLSSSAFTILVLRDERQPVSAVETTEWEWSIEPTKTGRQTLYLTVSAFVRVTGEERKRPLVTFSRPLEIRVTPYDRARGFVQDNWKWLWTTILAPLGAWFLRSRFRGSPS
jgi:hypothetical protein